MMLKPELSRPLLVSRIPAGGSHEHITASSDECAALAIRMKVPAIHALAARLHVAPWRGGGVKVTGTISVGLDQVSVVSLEPFRTQQSFEVERYFLPSVTDDDDADAIEHGEIDLGEVTAETVALDLDPYPRKPDEDFDGFSTGEIVEDRVSPFSGLKRK